MKVSGGWSLSRSEPQATLDRLIRVRTTNRPIHRALWSVGLLTLYGLSGVAHADNEKIERYATALTASLDSNECSALARIAPLERKLLALRSYLRAGANLQTRWSWTDEQIRSYEHSIEYQRLRADIDAITKEFERRNPGYSLYANTQVRSLDTQIERWNSNPRVGATAGNLYKAARDELANLPRHADSESLSRFERFLKQWRPSPGAPLAAPGLSMHGQSRAIDFQIMKGGQIVAATELNAVAREWEATGWSRKLKVAVNAAGPRFKGPLAAPNEPWHYEYAGRSSE
jgi:hypothetical protein